MSVTKLKTVGSWQPARWRVGSAELRAQARGRVITGMLTAGDPCSDVPLDDPEPPTPRRR